MRWSVLPSAGLVLVGLFIAVNRVGEYLEYALNPPVTRLGFFAEMLTLGFLLVAGGLVAIGVIGYRRNWVAFPSAILVGTLVTLYTFGIRLYTHAPAERNVLHIWLLYTLPPTIATYAILRLLRNSSFDVFD